jgi:integrase
MTVRFGLLAPQPDNGRPLHRDHPDRAVEPKDSSADWTTVRKTGDVLTVPKPGVLKVMAKSAAKRPAPATVNRTVGRQPNASYRTREHLTAAEIEKLLAAARNNRWSHRDSIMILVAYRHGMRVSELVDLRWEQIDFNHATLHVRRVKQGTPATHPIVGDEMRALRCYVEALLRCATPCGGCAANRPER